MVSRGCFKSLIQKEIRFVLTVAMVPQEVSCGMAVMNMESPAMTGVIDSLEVLRMVN